MHDECPLASDYVEDMFMTDEFFDNLELMDNDTLSILNQLKKKYNVVICSIGTPINISKKAMWIEENLEIRDMILLSQSDLVMDKSTIDMSDGIIIDDHENNLFSSSAQTKICFGKVYPWNANWDGVRISNWKELGELLL